MRKGESVRCIDDYDLFDLNINGEEGCFIKLDKHSNKYLIYFWVNGEWAELRREQFKLINDPGYIPMKNKKFVKNTKTLEYSFSS